MLDTGMSLRSGSTSKQPDEGPTVEGDGTNRPTIEYDTLVVAFIEALSDPLVVAKLNKAIDYDRIFTAVSNHVEILIKPLTDKLAEKDAQIDKLDTKCQALEERCDDLEQYSRKDSIRIFGLAEPHDENPFDSVTFLCNTQMKINPPVQIDEIGNCHRIDSISPQATKPRPMIVRFATNRAKQRVMEHRKKLKGIDGNSILGPKPSDVDAEDGPVKTALTMKLKSSKKLPIHPRI